MKSRGSIGGWYFGWNIVAASAIATLLTVGVRLCVGPFFLPMAGDLALSRSLLSGIVATGMLCYGIGMPLAGHLVGTRGTRFVLSLGAAMVIVALVWTAHVHDAVSLLLAFGVLLSFGLSFTSPVAFTPVLSRWFIRQRGMAMFFLSTGSMAGIAILTPAFAYAIGVVGWRDTLLGFAGLFALLMFPIIWFVIRDDAPAQADLLSGSAVRASAAPMQTAGMNWREAVCTGPFWKVALGLFTCGYSMNLLGTHGVPMLMDHGFDSMTSSFGLGLTGLVAIFSTLVLGRLSDRLPRKNILAAIYLIRGLGFVALVLVGTQFELYAATTISGIAWAGSIALSSAILADTYGIRSVGILYGWTYFGHQIGAMISSWLGGWAYEAFGTHWIAFGSAALLLVAAAAISLRLPANGVMLVNDSTPETLRGVST